MTRETRFLRHILPTLFLAVASMSAPLAAYEVTCGLDQDTVFWVGTRTGLVKMEKGSGKVTFIRPTDQGEAYDHVWSLAADGKGGIWLGLNMGGLARFDGKTWTSYTVPSNPGFPLRYLQYMQVYTDSRGNLWVHGYEKQGIYRVSSGLLRFNGSEWTYLSAEEIPAGPFDKPVSRGPYAMALDTAAHAWIISDAGLYEYFDSSWKRRADCPSNVLPNQLVVTSDGRIWTLCLTREHTLLYVLGEDGTWKHGGLPPASTGWNTIRSIGLGREGELWIDHDYDVTRIQGSDLRHFADTGMPIAPVQDTGIYLLRSQDIRLRRDSAIVATYSLETAPSKVGMFAQGTGLQAQPPISRRESDLLGRIHFTGKYPAMRGTIRLSPPRP